MDRAAWFGSTHSLPCLFNLKISIEYESSKSQHVSFCVPALLSSLWFLKWSSKAGIFIELNLYVTIVFAEES